MRRNDLGTLRDLQREKICWLGWLSLRSYFSSAGVHPGVRKRSGRCHQMTKSTPEKSATQTIGTLWSDFPNVRGCSIIEAAPKRQKTACVRISGKTSKWHQKKEKSIDARPRPAGISIANGIFWASHRKTLKTHGRCPH